MARTVLTQIKNDLVEDSGAILWSLIEGEALEFEVKLDFVDNIYDGYEVEASLIEANNVVGQTSPPTGIRMTNEGIIPAGIKKNLVVRFPKYFGEWKSDVEYTYGDRIIYNSVPYECLAVPSVKGVSPIDNNSLWQESDLRTLYVQFPEDVLGTISTEATISSEGYNTQDRNRIIHSVNEEIETEEVTTDEITTTVIRSVSLNAKDVLQRDIKFTEASTGALVYTTVTGEFICCTPYKIDDTHYGFRYNKYTIALDADNNLVGTLGESVNITDYCYYPGEWYVRPSIGSPVYGFFELRVSERNNPFGFRRTWKPVRGMVSFYFSPTSLISDTVYDSDAQQVKLAPSISSDTTNTTDTTTTTTEPEP